MIKLFGLFILSFVYGASIYSQSLYTIKGQVQSSDNKLIHDALVTLYTQKDSSLYRTTWTDSSGYYYFDKVNSNTYFIKIEAVEFEESTLQRIVVNEHKTLPTKVLDKKISKNLHGVNITGGNIFVQKKVDRMIVNPNVIISNAGLTAFDVLGKSPGISIDMNDHVIMRGKQGVLIFIDDKPTYMSIICETKLETFNQV